MLPKDWTPEHYQIAKIFTQKPPKRKNDWMLYHMTGFGGYRPPEIQEDVAVAVVDWLQQRGQGLCSAQKGKECDMNDLVAFVRPLLLGSAKSPVPTNWTPEHYQIIQIFVDKPPKKKNDWMLYKMSGLGGYRPPEIDEDIAAEVVEWLKGDAQALCTAQKGEDCKTVDLVDFIRPFQNTPAPEPPAKSPMPADWTPEHYQIIQIFVDKPPKKKNDWMLYKMSGLGGYGPPEIDEDIAAAVVEWLKGDAQALCAKAKAKESCAPEELAEYLRPFKDFGEVAASPAQEASAPQPAGGGCSGGGACPMRRCAEEKHFRRLTTAKSLACSLAADGIQVETYFFTDSEEAVVCTNKGEGACSCGSGEDLSVIPGEFKPSEKDCESFLGGAADPQESLIKLGWLDKEGAKLINSGKPEKNLKMIFQSNVGSGTPAISCAKFLATDDGQVWLSNFNDEHAVKRDPSTPSTPKSPKLGHRTSSSSQGQDLVAELREKLRRKKLREAEAAGHEAAAGQASQAPQFNPYDLPGYYSHDAERPFD